MKHVSMWEPRDRRKPLTAGEPEQWTAGSRLAAFFTGYLVIEAAVAGVVVVVVVLAILL